MKHRVPVTGEKNPCPRVVEIFTGNQERRKLHGKMRATLTERACRRCISAACRKQQAASWPPANMKRSAVFRWARNLDQNSLALATIILSIHATGEK